MFKVYKNCRVFITGVTGFKGSWLSLWLTMLGATVKGYSLEPIGEHNHFDILELNKLIENEFNDVRNIFGLKKSIEDFQPDIVISASAQPIVRESYKHPILTFNTNTIGTLNLLEACREVKSIQSIIIITTDKVYSSKEWVFRYRETDRLGGYDPYSASKVCAEVIVDCYRKSFYKDSTLIASVRAGNVIGGGDWSTDRLVPNIIKSIYEKEKFEIRSPQAIRPWQHTLDCLSGYLTLGEKLLQGNKEFEGAWNFGPEDDSLISVEEITKMFSTYIPINYTINEEEAKKYKETDILKLDITKSKSLLKWKPKWGIDKTVEETAKWYREYYEHGTVLSEEQIKDYMKGK